MDFVSIFKESNIDRKVKILKEYLRGRRTLLDFGCGDLSLATKLVMENRMLRITGIDIVHRFSKESLPNNVRYVKYDGTKLPFKNRSFDIVLCFYVLHHCDNPEVALRECARVAKKSVIIVESVPRSNIEVLVMGFVDWIFNAWKVFQVPITFKFYSRRKWEELFRKYRLRLVSAKKIMVLPQPSFLPLGKSYLFLCEAKHSS